MELLKNPLILSLSAIGGAAGAGGLHLLGCTLPWVITGGIAGAVLVPAVIFYVAMSTVGM